MIGGAASFTNASTSVLASNAATSFVDASLPPSPMSESLEHATRPRAQKKRGSARIARSALERFVRDREAFVDDVEGLRHLGFADRQRRVAHDAAPLKDREEAVVAEEFPELRHRGV